MGERQHRREQQHVERVQQLQRDAAGAVIRPLPLAFTSSVHSLSLSVSERVYVFVTRHIGLFGDDGSGRGVARAARVVSESSHYLPPVLRG